MKLKMSTIPSVVSVRRQLSGAPAECYFNCHLGGRSGSANHAFISSNQRGIARPRYVSEPHIFSIELQQQQQQQQDRTGLQLREDAVVLYQGVVILINPGSSWFYFATKTAILQRNLQSDATSIIVIKCHINLRLKCGMWPN